MARRFWGIQNDGFRIIDGAWGDRTSIRYSPFAIRHSLRYSTLLALIALPVSSAAGQTIYDFSTGAGVDRFAFGKSVTSTPIPPTVNNVPANELFGPLYSAIAVSDASLFSTGTYGGTSRAAVRFQFTVLEPPPSITQLDVLWEGGGIVGGFSQDQIDLWVWNAVTTTYVWVGQTTQASPPDSVVLGSFTTNAADYVDGANMVTLLVINSTTGKGILTDYVKITVTGFICSNDAQCDDGDVCTQDVCSAGVCVNSNNTASCDDGLFCTATDACSAGTCLGTGDACPGQICDEGADQCFDCLVEGDCEDGIGCTIDTCVSQSCVFTADDSNCADGLFCNGNESCDPVLDCQAGADPCQPTEFCNETADTCDQCAIDGDCDDGDPCTANTCNLGVCDFSSAAQITVDLDIEGIGAAVPREVTFVVTVCGGPVDARVLPVAFDASGAASVLLNGIDSSAGWLSVSEGHTLRQLAALSFTACAASVDLTGPAGLRAGDFHTGAILKDNLVDITDFSILGASFNLPIDPTSAAGADATGDGVQGTADFTAIQVNFFTAGAALDGCTRRAASGAALAKLGPGHARPRIRRSLESLNLPNVERADVNGDGVIDPADVRAFARRLGIPLEPRFDRLLTELDSAREPKATFDR